MDEIEKNLDKLLKILKATPEQKLSKKPLCLLTPEEISRFKELHARSAALKEDIDRASSKINGARDRLWLDIKDNHNVHGKSLHYNEDEGALYEILDDEE